MQRLCVILTFGLTLTLWVNLSTATRTSDSGPCKTTALYLVNGTSQYCGRGGKPCPVGTFCDVAPNDAYASCCLELKPATGPCEGTTPFLVEGEPQYCGLGGKACPTGAFCDVAPNDAWAQCCTNKE